MTTTIFIWGQARLYNIKGLPQHDSCCEAAVNQLIYKLAEKIICFQKSLSKFYQRALNHEELKILLR